MFIGCPQITTVNTPPNFQQIPLTARHMLGKVFLSSLFLWHVMPFSPKKLWTDFFYYEKKTWNGITCNLNMRFILPSGVFFGCTLSGNVYLLLFVKFLPFWKRQIFAISSFAIIAEIVFASKVCVPNAFTPPQAKWVYIWEGRGTLPFFWYGVHLHLHIIHIWLPFRHSGLM